MDLFPFVKILFTDPEKYENIRNQEKNSHFFMINRFMSINYPNFAQLFNKNGIAGFAVIDTWHEAVKKFKRVPGWIYTKTKKTSTNNAEKAQWKPDEDLAKIYMEKMQISPSQLQDAIKYNEKEMKAYFRRLKKSMTINEPS